MVDPDLQLLYNTFPSLNAKQKEQFASLKKEYSEWNEKINVISRKDIDKLYERHVLHSLGIACCIQFKPGTRIMDIGCGGGFPSVPLAILFPDVQFTAVDSIGKKIKVVQEISQAIGLTNITAIHARAETIPGAFDFILSRAVAPMADLVTWTSNKILKTGNNSRPNGYLFLKGGDLTEEYAALKKHVRFEAEEKNLSEFFPGEFFETKKVIYIRTV